MTMVSKIPSVYRTIADLFVSGKTNEKMMSYATADRSQKVYRISGVANNSHASKRLLISIIRPSIFSGLYYLDTNNTQRCNVNSN